MNGRVSRVAIALLCVSAACTETRTGSGTAGQPWTAAGTVQPADLVRELAAGADKPLVVYIGPAFLYRQ